MVNTGSDWFFGNATSFVKTGKSKSGKPLEFCLFVNGGKEIMLLYLIGHREQARICARVCKCDSLTARSAQNATNADY